MKKNTGLGLVILILVGVLVYSNTFFSPFHFDDQQSICSNYSIRDIWNFGKIWDYWPTRFITYLSLAVNYHFNQLNVLGYHLFNLIVHEFAAILVWLLVYLALFFLFILFRHKA
jgi:hypothetical protein